MWHEGPESLSKRRSSWPRHSQSKQMKSSERAYSLSAYMYMYNIFKLYLCTGFSARVIVAHGCGTERARAGVCVCVYIYMHGHMGRLKAGSMATGIGSCLLENGGRWHPNFTVVTVSCLTQAMDGPALLLVLSKSGMQKGLWELSRCRASSVLSASVVVLLVPHATCSYLR